MGLGGLLVPLLVLGVAGSQLQLVTDLSSQALLGSGVLVKCRFDVGGPVDLSALRVQWYLFEERIAQYDQGRVESQIRGSLSEQELKTGDASLLLSSVTVSDEGPYKCVVGYGTEQLQGETTLRVLAAPRLSIPRRAAGTDTASSFPCHVWGFYPGDVTVTWLRDGRVLNDATSSAPQRNPDGTFNLTLTYTFTPTTSDSGSIFSCRVTHAALAQPLREEFPLAVTGADHTSAAIGATLGILVAGGAAAAIAIYCWRKRREGRGPPYSVSEVLGPARCLLGQEVTLSCAMEGKFPKDTAVTWERIHGEDRTVIGTDGVSEAGEGSEHQPLLHPQPQRWRATQERSPCKERSGTCLTASLSFTPTVQDDGARVRCSFHHKSRGIREQRESGEIQLWAQPQVSEIQVLPHWEPRDQVPFAVQIENFYPRGIHRIQWSWDGKSWEKSEPTDYSENPDLTFSATSVWRIPSRELNRLGLRVRVSVQQSPQEPPIEREIRAEDTAPAVSEISNPESVTAGKEITLSCRMTGHFPGALSVAWLRTQRSTTSSRFEEKSKGEILVPLENSAEYRIDPGAPHTQDGKSFQQETRLSFTPSVQRDQWAEFFCRVGHVTLEIPLERRTGELHVAVPQAPVLGEISRPQVLAPGEQVILRCHISRFYPKELSVTWHRRGRGESEFRCLDKPDTHKIVTPDPTAAADRKSYSVTSQLRLTPVLPEDDGAEYRCSVEHQTLQEPEGKSTGPLELRGRADSAPTKPSASENRSRDAQPASSPGAAAVTGPLVEEGAGDTAPKGNAGGDGGAETKSENDSHKGTTTTQNDTARATPAREQARDGAVGPTPAKRGTTSDTSAREQARDGTASPTPAKGGTTSDASAKERAGDNAADEDTTSDASAKERAGDNTADEDTTSELAEGGPGGARPAIGVVGDRVASTTPVTKVAPDAVVSAPPAGGPEPNAEASATRGGDDADRAKRVEEPGADGTAGAFPGSSEQTA